MVFRRALICAACLGSLLVAALRAEAPLAQVLIRNGGMTQGISVPGEWRGKFGDCTVSRDTTVFKEGPASLCVTVNGKSGQAFQRLEGLTGRGLGQDHAAAL